MSTDVEDSQSAQAFHDHIVQMYQYSINVDHLVEDMSVWSTEEMSAFMWWKSAIVKYAPNLWDCFARQTPCQYHKMVLAPTLWASLSGLIWCLSRFAQDDASQWIGGCVLTIWMPTHNNPSDVDTTHKMRNAEYDAQERDIKQREERGMIVICRL